jgi:hypothetical protein
MFRLCIAAAVGYAATRVLLDREVPDEVPEPLRAPLVGAQSRLRGWRALAREAMNAAAGARDAAERELHADYLARSGRG